MTARPRDRLIAGAIDLIRRKGVAGTGMTELVERSRTARRSIYQNFPGGKQELVEEAARTAGKVVTEAISAVDDREGSLARLGAFMQMWRDILVASDFQAGCPVVAAALGGAEVPTAPAIAAETFADWQREITVQLEAEGLDPATAEATATLGIAAIEGGVVLAIASRSLLPLDQVTDQLGVLLTHQLARSVNTRSGAT
ncbi:TetR/AcrR family transcriptional regulator [Nocardia sp. NPDC051570]|uniref:TetR/AcrR family transcriptional regulator n=1 Tax=Nocardia sp. NPDC051570 TaxID=3364324 RepID=UPI0037B5A64C